ncbi:hypothetical protein PR001_g3998 [Phytophthora rubi]|uniref:Uncharacterized protein n=1 Tax=Phytophthora rubi TaxID=129364 RepID=A0A6A3N9H0_9STRA|nr:hypothetical protein PR002_g4052 [Phytophthora rubi]KAE9047976.1 hypothetical protein PR001_g3998 [Phytophthora rubi]
MLYFFRANRGQSARRQLEAKRILQGKLKTKPARGELEIIRCCLPRNKSAEAAELKKRRHASRPVRVPPSASVLCVKANDAPEKAPKAKLAVLRRKSDATDAGSDDEAVQVEKVVPAAPDSNEEELDGEDAEQIEPLLKRQRQEKRKRKEMRKQRIMYSAKADCMVISEMVSDEGIFNLLGSSKPERWIMITQKLAAVFYKEFTADKVRKHVEKLKRVPIDAIKRGSREPEKDIDKKEPERLMEVYLPKKDDETLVRTKRAEGKTKKLAEYRAVTGTPTCITDREARV